MEKLKYFMIQFLLFYFNFVLSKRKNTRSKDVRNRTKSFSEFLTIIFIIFLALILPLIFTFIYKIIKDPATPGVINYYWNSFKSNSFGYLGTKDNLNDNNNNNINKKKVNKLN